jgi:hypothetical protein
MEVSKWEREGVRERKGCRDGGMARRRGREEKGA